MRREFDSRKKDNRIDHLFYQMALLRLSILNDMQVLTRLQCRRAETPA